MAPPLGDGTAFAIKGELVNSFADIHVFFIDICIWCLEVYDMLSLGQRGDVKVGIEPSNRF